MKKLIAMLLTFTIVLVLCSCSSYRSAYSATMLIKSDNQDQSEVKFDTLKGTLVFNKKVVKGDTDGFLHYEATLEEGELSVYYDVNGVKELLFTIKGGERLDNKGGQVHVGDKVTIIIETNGTAKDGEIEIEFD